MNLIFSPFLFDSEDAWRRAIKDPEYRFDMPMSRFMIIYARHRIVEQKSTPNIALIKSDILNSFALNQINTSIPNEEPKKAKEDNCILSQSEIDALLNNFILTK